MEFSPVIRATIWQKRLTLENLETRKRSIFMFSEVITNLTYAVAVVSTNAREGDKKYMDFLKDNNLLNETEERSELWTDCYRTLIKLRHVGATSDDIAKWAVSI